MDKKPLMGVSICAVVLLVLASLTNVVGYQSVKSTAVNDSPLFTTRTQRATYQQQNILTSKYLGMGKGNDLNIFIPNRNNERILLQKALNRLHEMDDTTFTKFLRQVLIYIPCQDENNKVNVPQLITALQQIRENPKAFEQYVINDNNESPAKGDITINRWFPGCLIFVLIRDILFISITFIWVILTSRINTCLFSYTCDPVICW